MLSDIARPFFNFFPNRSYLPWLAWLRAVETLRPACARNTTFLWLTVVLAALCLRPDLGGVTSLVRALGLSPASYHCLLHFFHSDALNLEQLTRCWRATLERLLARRLVRVKGRPILLVDGLKRGKEGRKMPAVKCLHQESGSNAKADFIMGHSLQAVAVLAQAAGVCLAVPLAARIHEGIGWSNRDRRTLLDKMGSLILGLQWSEPVIVVADAYYAAEKFARTLLANNHHLVTRVKTTAVAYFPAPPTRLKQRGRRKVYGHKTKLRSWFGYRQDFRPAPSPVYGEKGVTLRYRTVDLLWRPVGCLVRFVAVIHPHRGCRIFLSTDLTLSALDILRLYGVRFKIEVAFKQAVHTLGTYSYHFWMAAMTPLTRRSGNQHLHRKSDTYRAQVRRKMRAYTCHIQTGVIAQGLLQILSVLHAQMVWRRFGSWIRTIRPGIPPSEQVVGMALRHSLPEFLAAGERTSALAKFINDRLDLDRAEGLRLAA